MERRGQADMAQGKGSTAIVKGKFGGRGDQVGEKRRKKNFGKPLGGRGRTSTKCPHRHQYTGGVTSGGGGKTRRLSLRITDGLQK